MRDLALIGFLCALFGFGFKRPFLFVLAYVYIDIVSPQRICYYLLNSVPISLIAFLLAIGGWAATDNKRDVRMAPRQGLLLLLLLWAGYTTRYADFPVEALDKWSWVWKALVFAIFLPLTLRTKLRFEALLLFMILCAASIVIVGGIKTLASGGGYGALNLMVDNNSGLYEGSIISTVAIAIIPVIFWLMQHGTIFPPDWRVRLFGVALTFACLLIPIGTQARTGLICAGLLSVLMLRVVKKKGRYVVLLGLAGLAAIPMLPSSYTSRMDTIKGYQGDQSASTRLAVWRWTWEYAKSHPLGGGFEAYRQNKLKIDLVKTSGSGGVQSTQTTAEYDAGRAFHSSYFEMLGEQGYPGLAMWLILHFSGLFRMEIIRRRYRDADGKDRWIAPLATALQHSHFLYLVGGAFVGIAFQPFVYLFVGVQIGFDTYLKRKRKEAAWRPLVDRLSPQATVARA
ncbi:putative O-glycosylation ligase, exosortase A system-associated [Flavisphingomonas formosensis]|uniref:putative O-glycosylation ligase, exosortase A system-associated n=1 Tax=Flavisphingomonas formosensis TaxID=861534 RepID=UPI0012F76D92|nr:putative O-glycosylation ligase, exosortase A system-associated [Sphingomonas formosensis]